MATKGITHLIVNSPYDEPKHHWQTNECGSFQPQSASVVRLWGVDGASATEVSRSSKSPRAFGNWFWHSERMLRMLKKAPPKKLWI